jgi:hypothetical protein
LFATIFYVLKNSLNPSNGLYEGYNEILPWDELKSLRVIIHGLIGYSTFLAIPVICLVPLMIKVISQQRLPSSLERSDFHLIRDAILLFGAGAFPYLAVGKSTSLVETHDWTHRQAILISLPISLLVGTIIEISTKVREQGKQRKTYSSVLLVVSLILPIYLLSSGLSEKFNRLSFDNELVLYLQKRVEPPPPGIVKIELTKLLSPYTREYESNYLFFRAYGANEWWTSIRLPSDDYPEIPNFVNSQNSVEFVYKWIMNPCRSTLSFSLVEFDASPFGAILGHHAVRSRINSVKQTSNCEIPPN